MKLVANEAESPALREHLGPEPRLVASRIAAVELPRAAFRAGGPGGVADADDLLRRCVLVPYDEGIERVARQLGPAELGTLDAIHLASMLELANLSDLNHAIVYDRRLARAAEAYSVRVVAPGAGYTNRG